MKREKELNKKCKKRKTFYVNFLNLQQINILEIF